MLLGCVCIFSTACFTFISLGGYPVKITAFGGAKKGVVQQEPPLFSLGFETHQKVIFFWHKAGNRFLI
jgi:hypothetical protein